MRKKVLLSLVAIVLCIAIVGCGNKNVLKTKEGKKLKITAAETSSIEYEEFNNGNVKLKIPKGWKVTVPKVVHTLDILLEYIIQVILILDICFH